VCVCLCEGGCVCEIEGVRVSISPSGSSYLFSFIANDVVHYTLTAYVFYVHCLR
jgi:hypothetical protein